MVSDSVIFRHLAVFQIIPLYEKRAFKQVVKTLQQHLLKVSQIDLNRHLSV